MGELSLATRRVPTSSFHASHFHLSAAGQLGVAADFCAFGTMRTPPQAALPLAHQLGAPLGTPATTTRRNRRVSTYFRASTFTRPFGASPNISGAYITSTRVGGSEN
jgi:hypothetical protein